MTADPELEPVATADRAFNHLISAAVLAGILGAALALQGCAALRDYSACPPAQLRADGRGGFYADAPGCRP